MSGSGTTGSTASGHDIVVIGFSAGGLEPVIRLVAEFPLELPAAIFIVHHFPANSISALPGILGRAGPLPAEHAEDGEPVVPGRIYVAPPNRHMLLEAGRVHLSTGPREHNHRPAIDPLFRTAARTYADRVVGVLLSGTLDDGTDGLLAIKRHHGVAVVQDPAEALHPSMPNSAIQEVGVDHVEPVSRIAPLIVQLSREPAAHAGRTDPLAPLDPPDPAATGTRSLAGDKPPGKPSGLTCPECGGLLWESEDGGFLHYRCHVGHGYSEDSLVAGQAQRLESALWAAVRALEEKAELARHLARRTRRRGMLRSAKRFEQSIEDADRGSSEIRALLLEGVSAPPVDPADAELARRPARETSGSGRHG
ncbi:MAG TPA: chemotaxis protein CheB [Gemmatimonadales bacterium]|jgi:two-component system chemotaxis response regulator CheB|nr:chemotaxis protein CheB [Gemmatimonadales bacterium]